MTRIPAPSSRASSPRAALLLALALCTLSLVSAPAALAGGSSEHVAGVTNFGRVSDTYFRGGKVTAEGLRNLYAMGVRTDVDLAGSGGEEALCKQLGITYYDYSMSGGETPDDAKVAQILTIIQSATAPVYVHCSAGKHRAGTICALYRIRVQGWTPEQAWAEQQAYGFGSASGHPELYAYVYKGGAGALRTDAALAATDAKGQAAAAAPSQPEVSAEAREAKRAHDDKDVAKDDRKRDKHDRKDEKKSGHDAEEGDRDAAQ